MPTNSEVKETFSNLYGLKLDDLIYRYTNIVGFLIIPKMTCILTFMNL